MIITKTQSGFSVRFAFELKDAFKAAFPTAKWDPYGKTWNVGVRSEKRLAQFSEEIKEAEGLIEEREAVAIVGEQLSRVRELISSVAASTRAASEISGTLDATKEVLLAAQDKLEKARAEEQILQAFLAKKKSEIEEKISPIFSVDEILRIQKEMSGSHNGKSRVSSERFHTAQQEASAIHRKLSDAGFQCDAIKRLCVSNFNRPDRDGVSGIRRSEFLTIEAA